MDVGATVRRLRERRGFSLRAMADASGLTRGHLSRIENGEREPSWSALCAIAEACDLEPLLCFVSTRERREAESAAFASLDAEARLWRTSPGAAAAVMRFIGSFAGDVVVVGAAATVMHGHPAEIDVLEVVLRDDDEIVQRLVDFLLRVLAFYEPMTVEDYRDLRRTSWVVGQIDAEVRLVPELPPTVTVAFGIATVNVATMPHLLATDPAVAALMTV